MNALIRWVPLGDLADVQGRLSSIIGRAEQHKESRRSSNGGVHAPEWEPVVDVAENEGGYLLLAEVPGVREEDVSVKIDGRTLTISGERKPDTSDSVRYVMMERAQGSFSRSFLLSDSVDPEKAEARVRNGVLEVHLAKSAAAQPRVIPLT